jgi:hypothetical protein
MVGCARCARSRRESQSPRWWSPSS